MDCPSNVLVNAICSTPGIVWLEERYEDVGPDRVCYHYVELSDDEIETPGECWPSGPLHKRISRGGRILWEMPKSYDPGDAAPWSGKISTPSTSFVSSSGSIYDVKHVTAGMPFPDTEHKNWSYLNIDEFDGSHHPSEPPQLRPNENPPSSRRLERRQAVDR